MTARNVTLADLDALLRGLGFVRREIKMPDRDPIVLDTGDKSSERLPKVPGLPAVVYREPASDAMILLPRRPPDATAEPQHLIPTRRQLIEHGLIEEEDFDR